MDADADADARFAGVFFSIAFPPTHPARILTGGASPSGQDVSQPHGTLEGRTARTMP